MFSPQTISLLRRNFILSNNPSSAYWAEGSGNWRQFYYNPQNKQMISFAALIILRGPQHQSIYTTVQHKNINECSQNTANFRCLTLDFKYHVSCASLLSKEDKIWPTVNLTNFTSFFNF